MIEIDNISAGFERSEREYIFYYSPKYITVLTPSNEDLRHFQL
jgi:hypothetical protein